MVCPTDAKQSCSRRHTFLSLSGMKTIELSVILPASPATAVQERRQMPPLHAATPPLPPSLPPPPPPAPTPAAPLALSPPPVPATTPTVRAEDNTSALATTMTTLIDLLDKEPDSSWPSAPQIDPDKSRPQKRMRVITCDQADEEDWNDPSKWYRWAEISERRGW